MENKVKVRVCEDIERLLRISFNIDPKILTTENRNKSLFLYPFGFDGITMIYLLAEVEKKFQIRIEAKYFEDYSFSTIDGIVDVVYRNLYEKNN